jgi:hypothetical protein
VSAADAARFHPAYVAAIKGSMTALKKVKKVKKTGAAAAKQATG